MQSKLHFLISLDTTDNAARDLELWLLVLVVLQYRLHDGLFYRLRRKLSRELLMSAAPELVDVAMKKKSPKQALKNTVTKTARKQLAGGRRRRKTPMNGLRKRRSAGARKRKTTTRRKTRPVRTRADFFSNIKNDR